LSLPYQKSSPFFFFPSSLRGRGGVLEAACAAPNCRSFFRPLYFEGPAKNFSSLPAGAYEGRKPRFIPLTNPLHPFRVVFFPLPPDRGGGRVEVGGRGILNQSTNSFGFAFLPIIVFFSRGRVRNLPPPPPFSPSTPQISASLKKSNWSKTFSFPVKDASLFLFFFLP